MDIVRFKGGLGNQMFQYAFVEALRSRGREVGCSLGFYRNHPDLMPFVLDKVFKNIVLNEVDDKLFNQIDEKWKKIKESPKLLENFKYNLKDRFFWVEEKVHTYEDKVFQTANCAFVGYWQTEKYFVSIRETILSCFQFHIQEEKLKQLGEKIKSNYIGVHIRRGDYVQNAKYQVYTTEYYNRAMSHMKKKYSNINFIFFSDDTAWVNQNFNDENMLVCESNYFDCYQDWYDMYLMTLCRGNIISNSSFSWWGAWLNQNKEKIVIAPKIWQNGVETPDVWCEGWIKM